MAIHHILSVFSVSFIQFNVAETVQSVIRFLSNKEFDCAKILIFVIPGNFVANPLKNNSAFCLKLCFNIDSCILTCGHSSFPGGNMWNVLGFWFCLRFLSSQKDII